MHLQALVYDIPNKLQSLWLSKMELEAKFGYSEASFITKITGQTSTLKQTTLNGSHAVFFNH